MRMAREEITDIIHGKVDVQIGKNGISTGLIEQVKNQFKHRKYLKIRFLDLHFFSTSDEAAQSLANQTNSTVLDVRGKTAVLKRKKAESNI